jgi:hypothetical protein
MSRWTDEELRELATMWPTHSVSQLVELLHRPRWAIRSKAKRLRLDGMRPHNPSEDVEAINNPPKRRPPQSKMLPCSPRGGSLSSDDHPQNVRPCVKSLSRQDDTI